MTYAKHLREEGRKRGLAEGRADARAELRQLLRGILQQRLGALPDEAEQRLGEADVATLGRWIAQAAQVRTLDELWAEPTQG